MSVSWNRGTPKKIHFNWISHPSSYGRSPFMEPPPYLQWCINFQSASRKTRWCGSSTERTLRHKKGRPRGQENGAQTFLVNIWWCPERKGLKNGWFILEKPFFWIIDDLGYPHFRKPPYTSFCGGKTWVWCKHELQTMNMLKSMFVDRID